MAKQTLENGVETATCKICGQTVMLQDEARELYARMQHGRRWGSSIMLWQRVTCF